MNKRKVCNKDLLEYTLNKLEEVGLKDKPLRDYFPEDDCQAIQKICKECSALDLSYILSIGFANGILYANQHSK
jgi:hypothetical protein